MSASSGAPQPQGPGDSGVPGPKHQEQPVVWERWQKKRTSSAPWKEAPTAI